MCLLYFKKRAQLWLLRTPVKAAEIRCKRVAKKVKKNGNKERDQMEWNWHGLDNITANLKSLCQAQIQIQLKYRKTFFYFLDSPWQVYIGFVGYVGYFIYFIYKVVKFCVRKCKESKQRKTPTPDAFRKKQDNLNQGQQNVAVIEVQHPIEIETPV